MYAETYANAEIHFCTFESNMADFVSSSKADLTTFPELSSLQFPAGGCNNLQRVTAPSIRLGLGSTIQGPVSLLFSFLSHYPGTWVLCSSIRSFSAKRISQNFAPIPGGGHATIFDWMVLP
jgi:hypothetical protein